MASTQHLQLYKPTRDDYISVERDISNNMQKIDDAFGEVPNIAEIGIVINGNKATAQIATGQYAIVKDSTIANIADGLYTATKTIPYNTEIDETYLSAVTGGVANSILNSNYSKFAPKVARDSKYFDATTSWKYTGLSVTIPAKSLYFIRAKGIYNANPPIGAAISVDSDPSHTYNYYAMSGGVSENPSSGTSLCGWTDSNITFYFHAKYGSAGSNSVWLESAYIKYE